MKQDFDLLVIGTGTAGDTVAQHCREAGWKVAIADGRPPGGACAQRACDPKKVLLAAAEGWDWVHRLRGKGLSAPAIHIDWQDLMRFKRSFTEPVPGHKEEEYRKLGIAFLRGRAQFADERSVEVADQTYTADKILIATGSVPVPLSFEGSEHLADSDFFLDMEGLPGRIIFLGAGYVSFEFSHLAVRAGAQVRIVDHGATPLKHFDPDLTDQLLKATQQLGVDIQFRTQILSLRKENAQYQLTVRNESGVQTLEADLVVHGAGRIPNVTGVEWKKAGLRLNKKGGILVNDFLQSEENPRVYAAGDVTGAFPALTPVASVHARYLTESWLKGRTTPLGRLVIPSVAFTIPPIASVGLLEAEAKEQGLAVEVAHGDMSGWYAHRRVGEQFAGYKTLVDKTSGKLLGAHLLGHHSEELINLFSLAIRQGLTAKDLSETIYAYPTHGSNIGSILP